MAQEEKGQSIDNYEATIMTTLPQLDHFISLSQAARRLGLAKNTLRSLIDSGRIKGAVLPNGDIGVSEPELDSIITRDQFEYLRGQAITIAQAIEKYGLTDRTIRRWIDRGYIKVLKDGYGAHLDHADVAYCAAVYQALGGTRGKRLFNDDGQPYQLKRTDWATYQRERRKKKKTEHLS
jgi:hypothetical protein